MFTVKATYRNETRKFSYPDSVLFPTYEELHNQLYRLFPISHNYYLSRLVFSPDVSKPGRILVGREVHSAEDYDSHIAPLRRVWPKPLLRFTIFDAAIPAPVMPFDMSLYSAPTVPPSDVTSKPASPAVHPPSSILPPNLQSPVHLPSPFLKLPTTCVLPPPPPPIKLSPPPPPPIIFSPTLNESGSRHECGAAPCCSITKGKADIQVILSSFKDDLERILSTTFGTGHQSTPLTKDSASDPGTDKPQSPVTSSLNTSRWCFVCRTSFAGVWYGCVKCPWHAVCPGCFSKSRSAHTLSFGPSHVVQQRSTDDSVRASTQIADETKSCESLASSGSAGEPAPPIHRGVICDKCDKTIVGVRRKCLDCPDYDLCTSCMQSGAAEQHNPFHEFFDIETPGRVYVHTVLGERNHQQVSNSNNTQTIRQGSDVTPTDPPVRHSASCNLCDSTIIGERYKCLACPDFDTCSSCFSITTEQHPNHGFVKINKPGDLMLRDSASPRPVEHLAVCDSCGETVRGVRYKCMHSNCPDFDLCSACEALPIPVHPLNHPMLKLKTLDTIVRRVEQTRTTDGPLSQQPISIHDESPSLSRSPLATPTRSPEPLPMILSGRATNVDAEDQPPLAEEFLSPLGSPVQGEAPICVNIPPSRPTDLAMRSGSTRSIHGPSENYHSLWPRISQEMMHLNVVQAVRAEDPIVENAATEPLLAAPVASSISGASKPHWICPVSPVSGTKSVIDGYQTPSPMSSNVQELHPADEQQEMALDAFQQNTLDSILVGDTNVPDGQIFPPGAEFVKGWRMKNSGGQSWPITTEIRFVAGEKFNPERNVALMARVGMLHPGQDLDIWTGDLKAPDVPGRYVGYWRLNDGLGNFFGSSVWIDLTVVDHHSDHASEHSLASSSMVMPSAHPTNSVNVSDGLQDAPQPLFPSTETAMDDVESDISSVSLVSVPTSDDEDGEWQDTRTHSEPLEYVVLYDNRSEE